MALNEQNRKDLIALYWQKSIQTLLEAEVAIDAQKWSMAANRIYYASFHAVTALFIKDGYAVSTHRGVKQALGQRYILTNKLSADDGRLFAQLETMRDKADYDIIYVATESEIMSFLPRVRTFLADIKRLIDQE